MEKIDIMYMRRYTDKFKEIFDEKPEILQQAIDSIYDLWLGIADIFPTEEKAKEVYGLLVAWWIADYYPELTIGVVTTGGGQIKSKQIGGVKIQYNSNTTNTNKNNLLETLDTNIFGKRAKMMINLSHKRMEAY